MIKIKTPAVYAGTTVVYPGGIDLWENANIVDGYIVGYFSGNLFDVDGTTKLFNWEEVAEDTQQSFGKKITKLSFKDRFTLEELVFVELAAIDDPQKTLEERRLSATIRVLQGKQSDATYIDLSRSDTKQGVALVLSAMKGKIAGYDDSKINERYDEIINTPVQPHEVPLWVG